MSIKFLDGLGNQVLELNSSFRLDTTQLPREIPTVTIQGLDGEEPFEDGIRLRPRTISVVGVVSGATPTEVETELLAITAALAAKSVLRLVPFDGAQRYLPVRFVDITRNGIQGVSWSLNEVSINFVAHNPFWHATYTSVFDQPFVSTPLTFTINYPGKVRVAPVLWLHGATVGGVNLVNPVLTNQTTGESIALTGSIAAGQVLEVRNGERTSMLRANLGSATLASQVAVFGLAEEDVTWDVDPVNDVSVVASMNENWLVSGFHLVPGDNQLQISDAAGAASCHQGTVALAWRDAWY